MATAWTDTADRRACGGPAVHATRLIVVGIDGSEDADAALRWATHIGRAAQALVHVIAVCADGPEAEAEGRALVDAVVGRSLAAIPGSMIGGGVRRGDPADELVDASLHATMLVVGSHGRSGRARQPMGSVAAECARAARCPIVIVPGPDRSMSPARRPVYDRVGSSLNPA